MARRKYAKIWRIAVFEVIIVNNQKKYVRRPYDLVRYDWGDGSFNTDLGPGRLTYWQPDGGRLSRQMGANLDIADGDGVAVSPNLEVYDEIQFVDSSTPNPMGVHAPNP